MMKKLLFPVAVFSCLIFLRAAFAQGPDESAEPTRMTVLFRGDIVIEMESLENTDEALTLTLLYGSGDPAEDRVCEFVDGETEAGEIDVSDCGAVRMIYRYAPSPVPADSPILFALVKFWDVQKLRFASSDAFPDDGIVKRADSGFRVAFFGDDGQKLAEALKDAPYYISEDYEPTVNRTKMELRKKSSDNGLLFQYQIRRINEFVYPTAYDGQLCAFSDAPTAFQGSNVVLDGRVQLASGGGCDEEDSLSANRFDGPDIGWIEDYIFADPKLRQSDQIIFEYVRPDLKFAYLNPENRTVHQWDTETETILSFAVALTEEASPIP